MDVVEQPVFLVGSERSGSTLLRLMLDHHPDIAFNLESEFLVTRISDDGVFPEMEDYRTWLEQDRVFRHSRFSIDGSLDYAGLVNDFLMQKKKRDDKQVVGATVHYQFGKLRLIWPDAKYIYLYRDGRDVARSVVQMGWAGNPYVAADWWLEAEREWEVLRGRIPGDKWVEVRYEELIGNPQTELMKICGFIGTAYSDRMFDYTKNSSYAMPDPKLNYQWRKKMSRKDLRLIEAKIGSQLTRRGYELSGLPPISAGGLRNEIIRMHSRLAVLKYKVEKFGLGLVVQEMVSRHLGLSGWNRLATDRMNKIIDADLR